MKLCFENMNSESSFIFRFYKPAGISSFLALKKLKKNWIEENIALPERQKYYKTMKIGHCGILDYFAEGLLVGATGRYTKLLTYMIGLDKYYQGKALWGSQTDTLDTQGQFIRWSSFPQYSQLVQILKESQGQSWQRPPIYSRICQNGTRAYLQAQQGKEVILEKRLIQIDHLKLIQWSCPYLDFDLHCSKGTYVRALVRDWAEKLGLAAHLVSLKRIEVGPFSLGELKPMDYEAIEITDFLDKMAIEKLILKPEYQSYFKQGQALKIEYFQDNKAVFEAQKNQNLAVLTFDLACESTQEKNRSPHFLGMLEWDHDKKTFQYLLGYCS